MGYFTYRNQDISHIYSNLFSMILYVDTCVYTDKKETKNR